MFDFIFVWFGILLGKKSDQQGYRRHRNNCDHYSRGSGHLFCKQALRFNDDYHIFVEFVQFHILNCSNHHQFCSFHEFYSVNSSDLFLVCSCHLFVEFHHFF